MREKISVLLCGLFLLSTSAFTSNAYSAPLTTSGAPKEWTFLVFLNGNNNLDSFGTLNINQMEMVGSNDTVNVIVQWASYKTKKVQRLYIQKDNDPKHVTSPVVQDLGRVDMGDWHSLSEFIKWGAANYPAQHYVVDVWDHGSGFHQMQALSGHPQVGADGAVFHPSDISWDDFTGHFMTTKQLGQALAEGAQAIGHKIDVYGSDACLMAMAEVAGEMKDSVAYFVGSQDLEPGAGWPYDQMLKRWTTTRGAGGADVAKIIAEEYTKSYQGGSNGTEEVTASAFDLSKIGVLSQAVQHLGTELTKLDNSGRTKVLKAAKDTVKFTDADYGDLVDFIGLLESANVGTVNRGVFAEVRGAINEFVISNVVTENWNHAHGVSFWLPSDKYYYDRYSSLYSTLAFEQDTKWSEALRGLLQ